MKPTRGTVRLLLPAAALALLAACGTSGGDGGSSATGPVDPLTGVAGPTGPTVTVKVANTKEARPQSGLPQAGQVWTEEIEGGHLRFIAVYAGSYPAKIGPVRSGRETDIGLVPQFGRPGFAFAGADAPVLAEIQKAAAAGLLVDLGEKATVDGKPVRAAYTTDPERTVPYNFYAQGPDLAALATAGGATPPQAGFVFGPAADGSTTCSTLTATWNKRTTGGARWDASAKKWVLQFDGADLLDRESGSPQTAVDVVLLRMPDVASTINRSQYPVPVLQSYGPDGGEAIVLRDGTCTTGRWKRDTQKDPTTLVTSSGAPIALAPGNVWVLTLGTGPSLYDGSERTATTS